MGAGTISRFEDDRVLGDSRRGRESCEESKSCLKYS